MTLPDKALLAQFYSEWFEQNYCMKPAKAPDAALEFALAAMQRFGQQSGTAES